MVTKPDDELDDQEQLSDIIEGVTVLQNVNPTWFNKNVGHRGYVSNPINALMVEIIRRAIYDITLAEKIRDDALYFINHNSQAPWSFTWLCEQLDVPSEKVREYAKMVECNHCTPDGVRIKNCKKLIW